MIIKYIEKFAKIIENTEITNFEGEKLEHTETIEKIARKFESLKQEQHNLFLVGNGGSNAIVSHASIDFLNACHIKAIPITDSSHITCFANDYGYENVFYKPLKTLISPNDILIAVSSSGNSLNIVNAAKLAKTTGAFTITLSGFQDNNLLRNKGDFNFWLDSQNYGKVEIGHALLLHIITDKISKQI